VEDSNGKCIESTQCACYDSQNMKYYLENENWSVQQTCGSTKMCMCTPAGMQCTYTCDSMKCDVGETVMVDQASGCCQCMKALFTTTTTTARPKTCSSLVVTLPCHMTANMTGSDYLTKYFKLGTAAPGSVVPQTHDECTCPLTPVSYTPEIVMPSFYMKGITFLCVRRQEACGCAYNGMQMVDGQQQQELTADGSSVIPCSMCTCNDGMVNCQPIPGCAVISTTTPLISTTTTAFQCSMYGCMDGGVCHMVNETWNRDDCTKCTCNTPGSSSCSPVDCGVINCDLNNDYVLMKSNTSCCATCKKICVGSALRCNGICDCMDGCADEALELCDQPISTTVAPRVCDDVTYEHVTMTPCTPATYCRTALCNSAMLAEPCYSSQACCDCSHNTLFNGTKCVPYKLCQCMDEKKMLRNPGETWYDAFNPDCLMHTCIDNQVDTVDHSMNCPQITTCNPGFLGPVKVDGQCCKTCVPITAQTTTTVSPTTVPTTTAKVCFRDMSCQCVIDCFNPSNCEMTPACCADYVCPSDYQRNSEGACIKTQTCALTTTLLPTTPFTPKCRKVCLLTE
jgi:hypothetical protein